MLRVVGCRVRTVSGSRVSIWAQGLDLGTLGEERVIFHPDQGIC